MSLLVLLLVVAAVVALNAPSASFLPGFARLLANPRVEAGPLRFLWGQSSATGRLGDRDVTIRLQLKRSRYGQGYLVVAMRARVGETLNASAIDTRVQDDSGRRALFTLATRDVMLSVDDGWLAARWQPQGFVMFPGRFSGARWRPVLDAMQRVAESLERAG